LRLSERNKGGRSVSFLHDGSRGSQGFELLEVERLQQAEVRSAMKDRDRPRVQTAALRCGHKPKTMRPPLSHHSRGQRNHAMKKIAQILGLGIVIFAIGCASSGLPRGAYVVGGGSHISYAPPEPGTCILVEKTSRKVIATKSCSGDIFDFDATNQQDEETIKSVLGGIVPANAEFVLYFVSERKK
jgi:hypothetical protein